MTLNELFDALRSEGDMQFFGMILQEAFHNKPSIVVYEREDFDQIVSYYNIDYDNETLSNRSGNVTIIGYGVGVDSRDLKLTELPTPEIGPEPIGAKKD